MHCQNCVLPSILMACLLSQDALMPVEVRIGSILEGRHDLQIMVYDKNDNFTGEAGKGVGAFTLVDRSSTQDLPPQYCKITSSAVLPHDV